ncbi:MULTISPECIES: SDR family NAD(P)-dependent oxidoreductase [Burkholderia]|jgi:NAD(P)-dependent dehydrogenase (short-subunit alcohol dehydrogenase family)|uniref:SDR family NAD(P)-dependent oxidoreductase n=7 Tax=cellular organisms TaxID=131567 RepID=A0A2S5DN47_9BURK|nr:MULTISPECIES: SDR family NAD(P)-dependent oxidoreductase [Burkholderia]EKS9800470.1 SDR family oxidoreductase [Burkholderia cepacia]EKS9808103.1 SDR family oxidoreductase [Burkholderia cepacia]EKS9815673.1 SDR family oxidoreductase [Burkholderia cepacia]EKS9823476.1 SDR family oxidoreductase [Burkholderia cepacia]EKS9831099.1 SDR family oxidoreductase [Burkholderia cepacia]
MKTHDNKIAIITGGKQGIGRGIANLLAQRGAQVVIVNREKADEAAMAIGHDAIAIAADVTSEDGWAAVASQVEQAFGRVDILVHAAGIYPLATLDQMTPAEWRRVMAVNLDAHVLGARAIVPLMRKAGRGAIVTIGSDAVGMVTPPGMGFSHYYASKLGAIGLVRALANELAADNIIVNAVHPGITDTEGASGMPNEQKAQVYMQQAIKRLGTPADIAGPVAFLTSDDARFVTGQTLVVDGGWMRL